LILASCCPTEVFKPNSPLASEVQRALEPESGRPLAQGSRTDLRVSAREGSAILSWCVRNIATKPDALRRAAGSAQFAAIGRSSAGHPATFATAKRALDSTTPRAESSPEGQSMRARPSERDFAADEVRHSESQGDAPRRESLPSHARRDDHAGVPPVLHGRARGYRVVLSIGTAPVCLISTEPAPRAAKILAPTRHEEPTFMMKQRLVTADKAKPGAAHAAERAMIGNFRSSNALPARNTARYHFGQGGGRASLEDLPC
jgi:hypothetical protein